MAFIDPTADEIQVRFPVFADVDDAVIDTAIAETALYVDDTWINQENFHLAKMLLAAHILTCDGIGDTPEAELSSYGNFRTLKTGDLTISRGSNESLNNTSRSESELVQWLKKSNYGQRFLGIRNVNAPAIAVVC